MDKSIYNMMSMLINDKLPGRAQISIITSEEEKTQIVDEIKNLYQDSDLFNFLSESENNDWAVGLNTKDSEDGTTLIGRAYLYDATNHTIKSIDIDMADGNEITKNA